MKAFGFPKTIVAVVLCAASAVVGAQTFPSRPLRLVIGFPPGGLTDLNARLIGRHLESRLGQPAVVENRPGANATIAAGAVLQSAPDGHTLFVGGVTSISPFMTKASTIDPLRDFATVSNALSGGLFLFSRASLPVRSLQELVAYSKANPGKLNFGSSSAPTELVFQALRARAGLDATSVSYKGGVPTATALLAGEVDFSLDSITPYLPHVQSGKLRALFATTKSSLFPDVPTAAQAGLTGFDAVFNLGVFAPGATPREVTARLSREIQAIVQIPDVVEQFRKTGNEPTVTGPDEHRAMVEAELGFWREAARVARFEPQ